MLLRPYYIKSSVYSLHCVLACLHSLVNVCEKVNTNIRREKIATVINFIRMTRFFFRAKIQKFHVARKLFHSLYYMRNGDPELLKRIRSFKTFWRRDGTLYSISQDCIKNSKNGLLALLRFSLGLFRRMPLTQHLLFRNIGHYVS